MSLSQGSVYLCFVYFILTVYAERDLFEKKCKRECNTQYGTLDCWKRTTDGFTYGLSTAMVDYCQVIVQLRQVNNRSWYNLSRDVLLQQIEKYNPQKDVRQLTKTEIEQVAISLLNKCFDSRSPPSFQPSCSSCTGKQLRIIKQWRLVTIILTSICLLFVLLIVLIYTCHIRHSRRSYESIR